MTTAAPLNATAAHNLSQSARAEAAGQIERNSNYIPRGDTIVTLNYFRPPEDGSIPFNFVERPPEGQPQRNFGDFDVQVPITDIRGRESEYNLDKDAFAVVSNVPESAEHDFLDDDSIRKNYYPEVEKLILDHVPGSNRVLLFDHTIRRSKPNAPRAPVTRVHIDQTLKSATQRVHHPPAGGGREAPPRYPDRTGETAGIRYNDGQKWHYLSGMRNDERLFLECFDSEALKPGSKVQGGRVPHTAFQDPRTPVGAVGRESIEVRALVFGP